MTGIIILAHGSKREETKETLEEIIKKTAEILNEQAIEGAYLQLCHPLLDEKVKEFYQKGIRHIKVMPLFLFDGNHVRQDIPEVLEQLVQELPGLKLDLLGHIGADDKIAQIVADRIVEGRLD